MPPRTASALARPAPNGAVALAEPLPPDPPPEPASPPPPPPAPPPAPARPMGQGPRLMRRTRWVDVPEYPGFKLRLWVNYPGDLLQALVNDDATADERRALLSQFVLEHGDGEGHAWCDEDGYEYPPASDPAFWDAIPNELFLVCVALIRQAPRAMPGLVMAGQMPSATA